MHRYFALFLIALISFSMVSFVAPSVEAKEGPKIRVLAYTDEEAVKAEESGCEKVRETKGLKALVCPKDVATRLGLPEDIRVFAVDLSANSQIGANTVQSFGNTGEGTRIVILDTGYNYNHQELSSSYHGGYDFVNDDADPADDNGHGSHVAGIITADGIDDPKAKGVAPNARIIAGKVLNSQGSGFLSDTVAGIYWAVDGDFNADAISLSLGTSKPYIYKKFCDSVYPAMTNAIKYAKEHGVSVVVAAGNSGRAGVSLPGCISHSTTVGAVDSLDNVASFSGRGSALDFTAPGVSLFSTWLGTGYATLSGTSMATPVVSGTVALIKSAHPTYTPDQVYQALKTAKDLGNSGYDTSYGWGRIDAAKAVALAL